MPNTPPEARKSKPRFRPPDTMTREHWEAMRAELPDKIDDIIASFREDRLSVHPRAVPEHEDEAETEDWEEDPTTLLLPNAHRQARRRRLLGLLGLLALSGAAAALYFYGVPGSATTTPAPPNGVLPISTPDQSAPISAQGQGSEPPASGGSPAEPSSVLGTQPATTASSPAATDPRPESAAPAPKPKPRAKPKETPAPKPDEAEVRTVEDLTPLLRGKNDK